jgi:Outer membrane protein beta-barrel domain
MRIRRLLYLAGWLLVAACSSAGAQDAGKAGLSIGYPGGIGFIWHATDNVAVRPNFTYSRSTSDDISHSWGFGTDISILWYLKKYDNVRTYVSPRFSYSRNSSTSDLTNGIVPPSTVTGSTTGGAGLFGAQASLSKRFAVYGEAGLAFSRRKTESTLSTLTAGKGSSWGTTAGVGVIFYP